jgi:Rieske Fe-S protein
MRDPDCQPDNPRSPRLREGGVVSRLFSRRTLLKSVLGAGMGLQFVAFTARAEGDPRRARPQAGDHFVFSLGDRQGQLIASQDLPLGGPPLIAYPLDPATHVVRDGSRLNKVLLVRLAQDGLAEQTRGISAEGIVCYSAICTHTGCDVSGWQGATRHFVCPCHTSTFDPKDRARVISGPAPKPLAALPLQLVDGTVTAAGPFSGRVGAMQK